MDGESNASVNIVYVKLVKAKYEAKLMQHPHVVGVGIGLGPAKPTNAERGLALVVNVDGDVSHGDLPSELDGVPVTVRKTGTFKAL